MAIQPDIQFGRRMQRGTGQPQWRRLAPARSCRLTGRSQVTAPGQPAARRDSGTNGTTGARFRLWGRWRLDLLRLRSVIGRSETCKYPRDVDAPVPQLPDFLSPHEEQVDVLHIMHGARDIPSYHKSLELMWMGKTGFVNACIRAG